MFEKSLFIAIWVIVIVLINYILYQLGDPRTVWFFNLIGVGQ